VGEATVERVSDIREGLTSSLTFGARRCQDGFHFQCRTYRRMDFVCQSNYSLEQVLPCSVACHDGRESNFSPLGPAAPALVLASAKQNADVAETTCCVLSTVEWPSLAVHCSR